MPPTRWCDNCKADVPVSGGACQGCGVTEIPAEALDDLVAAVEFVRSMGRGGCATLSLHVPPGRAPVRHKVKLEW